MAHRRPEPGYEDLYYVEKVTPYTRLDSVHLADYLLTYNGPNHGTALIVLCNYVTDLQQRIVALEKTLEGGKDGTQNNSSS